MVDVRGGPVFASSDAFTIGLTVTGRSRGHAAPGARPGAGRAQLVVALQTLVSRDTPPMEPSVLTIGSIHGGTAPNIIPTRVDLHGTLRAFEPAVRERLLGRVRELVHAVPALWHVELRWR